MSYQYKVESTRGVESSFMNLVPKNYQSVNRFTILHKKPGKHVINILGMSNEYDVG